MKTILEQKLEEVQQQLTNIYNSEEEITISLNDIEKSLIQVLKRDDIELNKLASQVLRNVSMELSQENLSDAKTACLWVIGNGEKNCFADNFADNIEEAIKNRLSYHNELTATLEGNQTIKSFCISESSKFIDSTKFMQKFADILPTTQITSLTLSKDNIIVSGEVAKKLAASLPYSNVTNLVLNRCIRSDGVKILTEILPTTKITKLDLSENCFGGEELQSLVNILPQTQITLLNLLSLKYVDHSAWVSLLKIIPDTKLTELYFGEHGTGHKQLSELMTLIIDSKISQIYFNNNTGFSNTISDLNKLSNKESFDYNELCKKLCLDLIDDDYNDVLKSFIVNYNIKLDSVNYGHRQSLFDLLVSRKPAIRSLLEEIKEEARVKNVDTQEVYDICSTLLEEGNYEGLKKFLIDNHHNPAQAITVISPNLENKSYLLRELLGFLNEELHPEGQEYAGMFASTMDEVSALIGVIPDNITYTALYSEN
ncbi:hypothetical protein Trichorick_00023 [Candidatus Trichorickettsia mobilis]|uniref:Ran GTPase-activating protein (RanGAP) involved in mRNA processing and transport n=1 Tax=Candidatus Trichorickettsia mobilis TaxID=1346319 RepID=A0ABZ0UQ35_9RICK|nr:hypothetical protein [Candidatus Trichorickettsia mobilis]WPY00153.1 hypothetical protein Trichorick_00023 [Candidatus Trichorickettsia mobilis]